jgi:hypothetical protein
MLAVIAEGSGKVLNMPTSAFIRESCYEERL